MQLRIASLVASLALLGSAPVSALSFTPGHYYTSNFDSRTITEYGVDGDVLGSLTLSSALAVELRGLVFGTDGLLYATAERPVGYAVLALDAAGTVHQQYTALGNVGGNLSYGKIAVDQSYIYVANGDNLTRFVRGDPASGTPIYTGNQVFDVEVLPNGNLLVASAYEVKEITTNGVEVRALGPEYPNNFTDITGIEYVPETNDIFVTHLGHSNFFFRLMRLDGVTGALEEDVEFNYANDIFFTDSGELLVGSRTGAPRFYSTGLDFLGELHGGQQMFVTQYPATIPEPSTFLLLASGLVGVVARRR